MLLLKMLSKKAELRRRGCSKRCSAWSSRTCFAHVYDAGVERIDLADVRHAERQRWANGGLWDSATTCIGVGELLGGGGWYVRRYTVGTGGQDARRWAGTHAEHYARATARRWMRTIGGKWAEVG
jgi:hypothetical protein